MRWLIFVLGAVLSWGAYGVLLHRGQVVLGNPLKALLCVGVAYFLIGVLIPVGALASQGALSNFNQTGPGDGDDRGRAGRHRRRVHHLGVPRRRTARLRDAAGLRRRADRQRAAVDGDPSAEGRRRIRCCTSGSCSHRSAPGWCCTSGPRPEPQQICYTHRNDAETQRKHT